MYHSYTQDELRSYCKQNLENFEIWSRNLIHEKMLESYGVDYINYQKTDGNFLLKKELREHVSGMLKKNPERYKKPVDTLFIDDIVYILCHSTLYKSLFKEALDEIYPDGCSEVRTILSRLVPIRNSLSHSNPISMHQVERMICYTHDFIEGLKIYYTKKGKEKMWNVPSIIKVKDSLGNVFENLNNDLHTIVLEVNQQLYCGDSYSVEVEIDPSFSKSDYDIVWECKNKNLKDQTSNTLNLKFTPKDVGMLYGIHCTVISKNEWHKFNLHDSEILLCLTILPPKK